MYLEKVLPSTHYKDGYGYNALVQAMRRLDCTGRELPDKLTEIMEGYRGSALVEHVHIPHLHQLTDVDGRTIRDMRKMNAAGDAPRQRVRNIDLLQYISLCMQKVDREYAEYVQNWCYRQVMCLDEQEEEL